MNKKYIRHEHISMKNHAEYNERWVQNVIAEDPKIIGLGELVLRDRERIQPGAGRLDLLLQDPDTKRRYEVELQLGSTDEAHIVRTIEYWDIERKRYPQYDHCAVLIAEDITSRFLNVISLFNGTVPLIAIQMKALTVADNVVLVFTTVLDELSRGYIGEDEDAKSTPTDRAYWEKRGSRTTLALADQGASENHRSRSRAQVQQKEVIHTIRHLDFSAECDTAQATSAVRSSKAAAISARV